jgi:hypothetical protein
VITDLQLSFSLNEYADKVTREPTLSLVKSDHKSLCFEPPLPAFAFGRLSPDVPGLADPFLLRAAFVKVVFDGQCFLRSWTVCAQLLTLSPVSPRL